jgi:hypothetical protein
MTYQPFAPESASARRPDVVMLPPVIFERRQLVGAATWAVNTYIPYEPIDNEPTVANVSTIATREAVEALDPVAAAVNAMNTEQLQEHAEALIGTVDFSDASREEIIARTREQVAEVWAGEERADEIRLSKQNPQLDPSFYTQIGA